MLRIVGATLIALLLTACAPSTLSGGPSAGHLRAESVAQTQGVIPQPVQQIATLPRPRTVEKTETYSVVVNNIKVQDLLFALARDAKLNVDIHPGITGYVSMNAIDQTLPQLLTRISKQVDMRFELDGPNLAVMPDTPYLRNYKVDYVNMSRDVTSTLSTNTQISTSALTTAGGGGVGGGNTSRIQIENKSKNDFWITLEKNIKDLLHETDKIFPEGSTETVMEQSASQSTTGTGAQTTHTTSRGGQTPQNLASSPNPASLQNSGNTVVKRMTFREAASVIANPETGVITVRATSRQQEKVQEFLDKVMNSARRQVLIEATIVEVALSDGYQQGIDWTRTTSNSTFGIAPPKVNTGVTNPIDPFKLTFTGINLVAAVDLLRSFGAVKVLSSPKLTVMNNQIATLKVSQDVVYFRVEQTVVPAGPTTSAASATTTTPQSVSVGFFMNISAQISDNDAVVLNVRPSISSIATYVDDPNPALRLSGISNKVPQIRTREMESVMRVNSGDIAVLGGLMEDRQDDATGRIPGLGDIPIFGELFNKRDNSSTKTELVVFIRPTVIKDASIDGDYSSFRDNLPKKDFFNPAQVFQPFSVPDQRPEQRQ